MKKIFFLIDSYADLGFLYESLRINSVCKLVVYNKFLYEDLLKKYKEKDIIFIDLFGSGYKKILIKIRKIFLNLFIKDLRYQIIKELYKIDKQNKPNLWVTDTINFLSDVKTYNSKCAILHGLPFKNFFLCRNLLKYDYVFLPGKYHLNKLIHFKKKYSTSNTKFIISTSVKIIPYLKKNLFIKKNKYFDLLKLNIKKKTVLFCPTHDAFCNNRFFPSRFGSQFDRLINLADLVVNKLNLNFIIKLHHYHYKYLDNKILNSLKTWENLYIFKSNKDFDSTESKNIFYYSDILITDTSGSGVIGAFLNKKIIFMEPDKNFNWQNADISKNMRPGFICKDFKDLQYSLRQYLKKDKIFETKKLNFVRKIFYKDNNYLNNIKKSILSIS